MKDALYKITAVVLGVIVPVVITFWGLTYRRTDYIQVTDRIWNWRVSVTYTTTDIVTSVDDEGNISVRNETTTHTRCWHQHSGRELPPFSPGLPCSPRYGDDVNDHVSYHLRFELENGKSVQGRFPPELWDKLEPGVQRYVMRDVLGNIRGFASE